MGGATRSQRPQIVNYVRAEVNLDADVGKPLDPGLMQLELFWWRGVSAVRWTELFDVTFSSCADGRRGCRRQFASIGQGAEGQRC